MNEDTIPLEAGLLDRAISQSKGCYVGQEVIIRVLHRGGGRVAKRLMKMVIDGNEPIAAGAEILAKGVAVGSVTSSAFSARANQIVALGYIKREHAEAGTRVDVGGRAGVLQAAAS
jgi:folate-binding protein YgfZ